MARAPVELFTGNRPLLCGAEDFFESVRCLLASDGEENAGGDDGGLGVAVDVHTLALEALALFSFEGVFCVCVFDDLIVNDCLALVDFTVVSLGKSDNGHGESEVSTLLLDDGEPLRRK